MKWPTNTWTPVCLLYISCLFTFLSAFCLPFPSAVCLLLGSGHEMGCSWWNDQRTHDHRSLYDRIEKLSTIVHGSQFHLFWSPKIWLQVVFCLIGSFFDQLSLNKGKERAHNKSLIHLHHLELKVSSVVIILYYYTILQINQTKLTWSNYFTEFAIS